MLKKKMVFSLVISEVPLDCKKRCNSDLVKPCCWTECLNETDKANYLGNFSAFIKTKPVFSITLKTHQLYLGFSPGLLTGLVRH